ncbi:Ebp2-domain-containing protein [Zopfia rhizophila CBS 207.26]|uniref:Ebp2-domain-containing protein n=1 Tax=Zopfia rhizophila CBS 207.26 TaxID=1314779 RepID=A0A6A6EK46_9PEZI|nr:Ebp2-domain-containing protein [Zopfia rhizophila CBS 207.26]
MARSKLKGALDQYKGRDIKLEKQRKKEKEARKRNEKSRKERVESEEDEDEEVGGIYLVEEAAVKANGKTNKGKKNDMVEKVADEEAEWETEESDDDEEGSEEEEEDDILERAIFDMSRLEDSDSEGSSDDNAEEHNQEGSDDEAEEEEEDIPLSDIESLASEDKGDVIPHQRLTINNTSALLAALQRIQLPYSKMLFSEHQSVTTDEPVEMPDVEDDLNRELAFYSQSLAAVKDARAKLKKEGVQFTRPVDYFAEMVKSEEHMGKIKQKMIDEAAGKKAAAEARRQRDLKKFGKQVQVAKMQERAKEKRDTLEKINLLKRKRQGADLTNTNEGDLFDIELENAAKASHRRKGDGKPNAKRQKKDAKYGFGGKKRHAKSNDAISSANMSGYSLKKMREGRLGKKGGGASKRLGKSRRAKSV